MEELFKKLIEASKTNKKGLLRLKNAVVSCRQYELASKLLDIQKECFPETQEVKEAKKQAEKLQMVFSMVELNISEDVCWLI